MLPLIVPAYIINKLTSSLVDNAIRDTVSEPAIGSVVYCDLLFGTWSTQGSI